MQAFSKVEGIIAPLDRANVDTDAIIPKQYLKSIKRSGFGQYLFDDWRYLDPGHLDILVNNRRINPEFLLNQSPYQKASVLLARSNFGCGSSREHAVWALVDFGFRVVIASSFADIFYNNSFKNGLLPIVLSEVEIENLFQASQANPGLHVTVDLALQMVSYRDKEKPYQITFAIDAARKQRLLTGADDISLTLQYIEEIRHYEAQQKQQTPWLF